MKLTKEQRRACSLELETRIALAIYDITGGRPMEDKPRPAERKAGRDLMTAARRYMMTRDYFTKGALTPAPAAGGKS